MTFLPPRISRKSDRAERPRRCPSHRAWVRGHACSACGSMSGIECAHVRTGTDGGTGLKPSDKWCISLCGPCHRRQHQIGEEAFEAEQHIDMKAIAEMFYRVSPHRRKMEQPQ